MHSNTAYIAQRQVKRTVGKAGRVGTGEGKQKVWRGTGGNSMFQSQCCYSTSPKGFRPVQAFVFIWSLKRDYNNQKRIPKTLGSWRQFFESAKSIFCCLTHNYTVVSL